MRLAMLIPESRGLEAIIQICREEIELIREEVRYLVMDGQPSLRVVQERIGPGAIFGDRLEHRDRYSPH